MFLLRFFALAPVLVIGAVDDESLPERPRTRVDFDTRQPVAGKGVIKATGTYYVEDGYVFVRMVTRVTPSAGGVVTLSETKCKKGKWSDEVTISAGTYDVVMLMTMRSLDTGKETTWASRFANKLKVN
jgi:hypothetical protein